MMMIMTLSLLVAQRYPLMRFEGGTLKTIYTVSTDCGERVSWS